MPRCGALVLLSIVALSGCSSHQSDTELSASSPIQDGDTPSWEGTYETLTMSLTIKKTRGEYVVTLSELFTTSTWFATEAPDGTLTARVERSNITVRRVDDNHVHATWATRSSPEAEPDEDDGTFERAKDAR